MTDRDDDEVRVTLPTVLLGAAISLQKLMRREDADDICHRHLPIMRAITQAIERLEMAVEKGDA